MPSVFYEPKNEPEVPWLFCALIALMVTAIVAALWLLR